MGWERGSEINNHWREGCQNFIFMKSVSQLPFFWCVCVCVFVGGGCVLCNGAADIHKNEGRITILNFAHCLRVLYIRTSSIKCLQRI